MTSAPQAPSDIGSHPRVIRVRSLDGLRGIAAVLVLINHVLVTSPMFADPYRGETAGTAAGVALVHTPLHLLWGGHEAVYVFFVLSGYVLARPMLRARRSAWPAYYAQRLPRLFLPVWAALAVALVLALTVARTDVAGASWWLNEHNNIGTRALARSVSLLTTPSFSLNSPLWSLRWELVFSLLLPAFTIIAVAVRRRSLAAAVALLGVTAVGAFTERHSLMFLPIFGMGVLLAVEQERITRVCADLSTASWRWAAALCATSMTAYWSLLGLGVASRPAFTVGLPLSVFGSALMVVLFTHYAPLVALGSSRAAQWCGAVSFSLYLVHEPVVVALAFLLHDTGGTVLLFFVAVPVALLTAAVFFRVVERPSHDFARRMGARFAR